MAASVNRNDPARICLVQSKNGNIKTTCKICLKLTTKMQEDVIDVILVSLLLTLNKFHILFRCFHCWLWTSKFYWLYEHWLHTEIVVLRFSAKEGVLNNFAKITGKHLCHSLFFTKAADLRLQLYYKSYSDSGVFL